MSEGAQSGDAHTTVSRIPARRGRPRAGSMLALVILGSADEPSRVGELFPVESNAVIGRGQRDEPAASSARIRPGSVELRGPLTSPRLSRTQLRVRPVTGGLAIENVGRLPLRIDGEPVTDGIVEPGALLEIGDALVLGVLRVPQATRPAIDWPRFPFGGIDACGLVGESVAAWELRARIRFLAEREAHVLVTGPSGSGKELVAAAIHTLGPSGDRPRVARNASTLPAGLVDAELFGNVRGYPNPGMPERPGLVGMADGSTLFLDEIGEIPSEVQAHLLRVLDAGEYHRLGDGSPRRARFRLVAATNRSADSLKHDLAARLKLRIEVPGLDARPEDVPLLARSLLRRLGGRDPAVARYLDDDGEPRLSMSLVAALVRHPWTTHVRELEGFLWEAVSDGDAAGGGADGAGHHELNGGEGEGPGEGERDGPILRVPRRLVELTPRTSGIDRERVIAAMEAESWNASQAWRRLGLGSRWQLLRLLKRHGITRP